MTPLMLVPGMMCDARLFAPQAAALGTHRAIHVATITGHDSIAALAGEVLAHAPPRLALAGLSMGGIVAMEVFTQAPARVERLALLETSPRAELPEVKARRGAQMEKARAGAMLDVLRDEMVPNDLAHPERHPDLTRLCMELAEGLGAEVFLRQSLALRDRPDRQEALQQVGVPALVLCGRYDRLCPVARHELMHGLIPGSRLHIVEDAGHLPVLEKPEETNTALVRWLED